MNTSELIKAFHLGRLAIIYIRQSSPHQALTNQESTRLQYALKQRASELGWHEDQIRDHRRGSGPDRQHHRGTQGVKELVTLVTLEQVGIIFSTEVTRLVPQLLRLVSVARHLRLPQLPHRRPRRHPRPVHHQRTPAPRAEGPDLGAGAAYDPRPPDRRHPQQGPARRVGLDPAGRPDPRSPGAGRQAPRRRGPGPDRPDLRDLPPGQVGHPGRPLLQRQRPVDPPQG